jgi:hypothetical protein
VGRVWLRADDHDALQARLLTVTEFLADKFSFADDVGRRVRSENWLDLAEAQPGKEDRCVR